MKESIAKNEKDSGTIITLCDDMLILQFPEDFYELDSEELIRKFPYRKIPSFIRRDSLKEAYITFELYEKPLGVRQIDAAADSFRELIQKAYRYNHNIVVRKFQTEQKKEGRMFSFFRMVNCKKQYEELWLIPVHKRLCFGTASCPEAASDKWKPVFQKLRSGMEEAELKKLRQRRR